GRRRARGGWRCARAVVAAYLAALHQDFRIRGSRGPVLPVLAVDHHRHEWLAIDEVVDARALRAIGFHFEETAGSRHVRGAGVDDASAVAAELTVGYAAASK